MNVVVLVGRLARDPELRYTNTQMPVCTTSLAVDRIPSRNQAPDAPTADFIRITLFGKQAETFSRYLTKGRQVAVEGRLSTGSYTNQKGDKVYTTDVIVNRFDFIGSRSDSGNVGNYGAPSGGYGSGYGSQNYGGGQSYGNQNMSYDSNPAPSYTAQPDSGAYNSSAAGGYSSPSDDYPQVPPQSAPNIPEGFSEIDDDDLPF